MQKDANSLFERFSVGKRQSSGPSPLLFLLLFVCLALVVPTVYFYQVHETIMAGDVAYRRAQWAQAETAYEAVLEKTAWMGDSRIQCSDGSILFARSLVMEKIALTRSSDGKYEQALPYFEQALQKNENNFKARMHGRTSSNFSGNSFAAAQDVRRVLWNYTQVLITMHRDTEARKLKESVWSDLLALCRNVKRRRLERLLVAREAQLLVSEGFAPEGDSLKKQLAEAEKLPSAEQEDKLLPLLCVTVTPRSNPPLFDTFGVVPQ